MNRFIPVNEPLLTGNEKKYLNECIDTGWISSDGDFVNNFETQFGEYLGLPPGIAVCNGTAALETSLYGLGLTHGDEVIMSTFTIISCALAVLRLGAKPVLVDIDPETWCMDVNQIESKITSKTKVIMAIHIYGHPVNMDPILHIAEKYDLKIIEDAAEVHGAEYYSEISGGKWLRCGSIGDASAFSFYANKIITTGEGGMVLSKHVDVLKRAASYRNLCFKPENRFFHTELGYNFRMTNLQAAVGLAQIERINEFLSIKKRLGQYYRQRLNSISGIRFQVEKKWAKTVYWMYAIELDPDLGMEAPELRTRLQKKGIGTRPFFLGLHTQPVLQNLKLGFDPQSFPRSDHASLYGCYLPSGMALTEGQVDQVCLALAESLKE